MRYKGTLLNDLLSMVEVHLQRKGREDHSAVGNTCPNSAAPYLQTSLVHRRGQSNEGRTAPEKVSCRAKSFPDFRLYE
jgi:hypothetical protein